MLKGLKDGDGLCALRVGRGAVIVAEGPGRLPRQLASVYLRADPSTPPGELGRKLLSRDPLADEIVLTRVPGGVAVSGRGCSLGIPAVHEMSEARAKTMEALRRRFPEETFIETNI